MTTTTQPVDLEALRLERDRRWDAGETITAIDAEFRARGIDPRSLGGRPWAKRARPATASDPRSALERPETAGDPRAAARVRSASRAGKAARSAPTEAEIREALSRRISAYPLEDPRSALREAVEAWATTLTGPAYAILESPDPRDDMGEPEADDLWMDLRPSEAVALRDVARDAIARAVAQCERTIVEELVAAAVAFAQAHPDARRATA
jgi:hypothetical protein